MLDILMQEPLLGCRATLLMVVLEHLVGVVMGPVLAHQLRR